MLRLASLCTSLCLAPAFAQPLPSADNLIARYIQALGGRSALEAVHTRLAQGTIESPTYGTWGRYEEQAERPDRFVRAFQIERYGVVQSAYDGRTGWSELPEFGVTTLTGSRLAEMRREAQFDWPLKLLELYPGLRVRGRSSLLGREVVEAVATLPEGGQVRLLFDSESGLLACIEAPETAPDGSSRPVRVFHEDYRAVDGVMVPHVIRFESTDLIWIVRRTVVHNVPVAEQRFQKP